MARAANGNNEDACLAKEPTSGSNSIAISIYARTIEEPQAAGLDLRRKPQTQQ
jgi:hypothetical protein